VRSRILALAGLAIALGLLVPGLTLPVITIDGVLQPAGIAELAPALIERGVSEQSVATLRPLLNPAVLGMLDSQPRI